MRLNFGAACLDVYMSQIIPITFHHQLISYSESISDTRVDQIYCIIYYQYDRLGSLCHKPKQDQLTNPGISTLTPVSA